MSPKPKALFVLADGGRARFVERSPETRAFVTIQEIDGADRLAALKAELKHNPAMRSFQSGTPASHSTGDDDPYRQAKTEFAREVALAASSTAKARQSGGLVLVGPARILGPLRAAAERSAVVLESLAKDLTKTPDHELNRWLEPLERAVLRQEPVHD